ncbi:hypothetical protein GCM10017783_22360 [Deinococcus piscis]|uniref:Band 7 domain-containing protein n=1 Tax=Deinococcus piscis TaxID=394230 RepID=A0ABQ3KAG3_9DEIO|nr:hypothetical protein [Deinococcus piscis]GHG09354.1 hypothetical protein GCM10017783_22360 [Deinococcus piscis]
MPRLKIVFTEGDYQLTFDDQYVGNEDGYVEDVNYANNSTCTLNIVSEVFANAIKNFDIKEFSNFDRIFLYQMVNSRENGDFSYLNIYFMSFDVKNHLIDVRVEPDYFNWEVPISPTKYIAKLLHKISEEITNRGYRVQPDRTYLFDPISVIPKAELGIVHQLMEVDAVVKEKEKELNGEIINEFGNSSDSENEIRVKFEFPDEVRVYCEQYLLYFTNFLKDIGESAITNIDHENRITLFSIQPQGGEEALERIREAIAVYLNLPQLSLTDTESLPNTMAIRRLRSQILNLESQLQLVLAENEQQKIILRMQGNIIDDKDMQLIQVQRQLEKSIENGTILQDFIDKQELETENLFGNLVTLKKYDVGILQIDAPHIYRWLKEKFSSTFGELPDKSD